jgi:hypothetical protein
MDGPTISRTRATNRLLLLRCKDKLLPPAARASPFSGNNQMDRRRDLSRLSGMMRPCVPSPHFRAKCTLKQHEMIGHFSILFLSLFHQFFLLYYCYLLMLSPLSN